MKTSSICALITVSVLSAGAHAQLVNPGFETIEVTTAPGNGPQLLPPVTGDWQGDQSAIVTTQQGIIPFQGQRMLNFIGTSATGPGGVAAQVWQTVDMTPFSGIIASGNASANFQYWVNRVNIPGQLNDTAFGAFLSSHTGPPANFATNPPGTNTASNGILSDSNLQTWEPIAVTMSIPIGTTYLAIQISANENIFDDSTPPEFTGHYGDACTLTIVPEPASIACVGSAGLLALVRRRRTITS